MCGVVERAAIDRGVGADFDIVADFDDARLRKFPVAAFAESVSEAVGAHDRAGMNLDAIADAHTVVQSDARMDAAVFADPATRADDGVRTDLRAFADVGVFADDGVWADADAAARFARAER